MSVFAIYTSICKQTDHWHLVPYVPKLIQVISIIFGSKEGVGEGVNTPLQAVKAFKEINLQCDALCTAPGKSGRAFYGPLDAFCAAMQALNAKATDFLQTSLGFFSSDYL